MNDCKVVFLINPDGTWEIINKSEGVELRIIDYDIDPDSDHKKGDIIGKGEIKEDNNGYLYVDYLYNENGECDKFEEGEPRRAIPLPTPTIWDALGISNPFKKRPVNFKRKG